MITKLRDLSRTERDESTADLLREFHSRTRTRQNPSLFESIPKNDSSIMKSPEFIPTDPPKIFPTLSSIIPKPLGSKQNPLTLFFFFLSAKMFGMEGFILNTVIDVVVNKVMASIRLKSILVHLATLIPFFYMNVECFKFFGTWTYGAYLLYSNFLCSIIYSLVHFERKKKDTMHVVAEFVDYHVAQTVESSKANYKFYDILRMLLVTFFQREFKPQQEIKHTVHTSEEKSEIRKNLRRRITFPEPEPERPVDQSSSPLLPPTDDEVLDNFVRALDNSLTEEEENKVVNDLVAEEQEIVDAEKRVIEHEMKIIDDAMAKVNEEELMVRVQEQLIRENKHAIAQALQNSENPRILSDLLKEMATGNRSTLLLDTISQITSTPAPAPESSAPASSAPASSASAPESPSMDSESIEDEGVVRNLRKRRR